MANQQLRSYETYAAAVTSKNVEPISYKRGEEPESLAGEIWTESTGRNALTATYSDLEYGPVRVYTSNFGRVMERQSLSRGLDHIVVIHRTRDDHLFYCRPMGMFHYHNA